MADDVTQHVTKFPFADAHCHPPPNKQNKIPALVLGDSGVNVRATVASQTADYDKGS